MKALRKFGPGLVVTAAFIGPGTVTSASRAGAEHGYALLWAVLFSIAAVIVLQEMAARVGLIGRLGLGEAIRKTFRRPASRFLSCTLVMLAIGFGNAAYQTGNLVGATVGLTTLFGGSRALWTLILGIAAFVLLWTGRYRVIELVLVVLVAVMSVFFITTAILTSPPWSDVLRGLVVPTIPADSLAVVLALIGTTVVPYNLFLHASSVREKWSDEVSPDDALKAARRDAFMSIGVGGIITIAIVVSAAQAFFGDAGFTNVAKLADQLEPLLGGPFAKVAFAIGLFAAGLTSAITAPLAAAYAIGGVLGWEHDLRSWRFRGVWIVILVAGIVLGICLGASPGDTIMIAQIANGLLLPIIACFLLYVVNRKDLMGSHGNRLRLNVVAGSVVLVAAGLGIWKIVQQFAK